MKKGFLLFVAIALTIFGIYLGWQNYSSHVTGGAPQPPPGLALLTGQEASSLPKKNDITPVAPAITEQDRVQLSTLNAILSSKNDNDMRMDRELKVLDEGAKELLRKRYDEFPAERRNERGTIVFLLGRNLTSDKDFDFLHSVVDEAPCRSLQNCRMDPGPSSPESAHEETGIEVTLSYPQIVALKSYERVLERGESDPMYQRAMEEVQHGTHSSSEKIAEVARTIEARFHRKK